MAHVDGSLQVRCNKGLLGPHCVLPGACNAPRQIAQQSPRRALLYRAGRMQCATTNRAAKPSQGLVVPGRAHECAPPNVQHSSHRAFVPGRAHECATTNHAARPSQRIGGPSTAHAMCRTSARRKALVVAHCMRPAADIRLRFHIPAAKLFAQTWRKRGNRCLLEGTSDPLAHLSVGSVAALYAGSSKWKALLSRRPRDPLSTNRYGLSSTISYLQIPKML
jgi:hypothetical protein